jgi:hypothetical protein
MTPFPGPLHWPGICHQRFPSHWLQSEELGGRVGIAFRNSGHERFSAAQRKAEMV